MTQSDLEAGTPIPRSTDSPRETPPVRVDLWLNIAVAALIVAIVGGIAFFGYTVYRNNIAEDQSSATGRIAAALGDQVRRNPNDPVLRVRYGEALGAMGKYQQAIDQFNAALKINPKHTGAYLDLGMVAQLTNNYGAAIGYYQKVISLTDSSDYTGIDPSREQAYYNMGLITLQQRDFADAAGNFKAALRIRSDASDSYYNLAKAYQGLGDPDAAIQQLEIALQFDPGFAEAHYFLGTLYQQKKDDVNASYQFAQAVKLSPNADPPRQALDAYGSANDWISKATEALGTGDVETALNDILVARNLDANSFAAAKLHGEILVQRGNLKDALDVYKQAAALNSQDPEVNAAIAKLTPQVKALTPAKSAAAKKAAAKKTAAKKAAAKKAAAKLPASKTATSTVK
jgi:tetratricopeptide (TPR) repeat protein